MENIEKYEYRLHSILMQFILILNIELLQNTTLLFYYKIIFFNNTCMKSNAIMLLRHNKLHMNTLKTFKFLLLYVENVQLIWSRYLYSRTYTK